MSRRHGGVPGAPCKQLTTVVPHHRETHQTMCAKATTVFHTGTTDLEHRHRLLLHVKGVRVKSPKEQTRDEGGYFPSLSWTLPVRHWERCMADDSMIPRNEHVGCRRQAAAKSPPLPPPVEGFVVTGKGIIRPASPNARVLLRHSLAARHAGEFAALCTPRPGPFGSLFSPALQDIPPAGAPPCDRSTRAPRPASKPRTTQGSPFVPAA